VANEHNEGNKRSNNPRTSPSSRRKILSLNVSRRSKPRLQKVVSGKGRESGESEGQGHKPLIRLRKAASKHGESGKDINCRGGGQCSITSKEGGGHSTPSEGDQDQKSGPSNKVDDDNLL